MKAIVQDEYGSPGRKHHRVVVTRHGGAGGVQGGGEELPQTRSGEGRGGEKGKTRGAPAK